MTGEKILNSDIGMNAALGGLKKRGYEPRVVYDIGAADGSWTRLARHYWPSASYVCFEPLEERHSELTSLVQSGDGLVSVQLVGVGDSDCELSLGVTDFLWDSSFAYSGSSERTVPVRRLDGLIASGLPAPSFLKIDVQGFEKRVIEGGGAAILAADFILMECTFFAFCEEMRTLDVTIAFMASIGFIPYEFVDYLRRPLDGAMGQCDVLFIRSNHNLALQKRWA